MVTRAADYALRATLTLAGRPPGSRMSLSQLAAECEVPSAYLYKVLRALSANGLLVSRRGKGGGYELTPAARGSSVLVVVDALQGLPVLNTCLLAEGCHRSPVCPAHPIWALAQERMRETLASARIADLAGTSSGASIEAPLEAPRTYPGRRRRRPHGRERDDLVWWGTHRDRMADR
jgi:Rrf2 family iron-sulfur cluster assembly transcriptional regulator